MITKIVASFFGLLSLIGFSSPAPKIVGSAVPSTPALVSDFLATAITKSATTMTLASGAYKDGTPLSGYLCFTLDVNSPQIEYVCGTASSTSVTGLSRGISYSNPNTTSSALAYPHNRLASVTITNYPQSEFVNRKVNGLDTWDSKITYTTEPTFSNGKDLIDKTYADALSFSGAPNGSTIQKGIYQEASTTNIGNATEIGSTGADLIVPNKYFNTTSSATTTVPVTNSAGKLSQGFTDYSLDINYTGTSTLNNLNVNGTTTVNGAASFNATTSFSGTATTTFTSPVLGAGFTHATYFTTVGTSTWTKPTNVQKIYVIVIGGGGTGGGATSNTGGGGGAGGRGDKIIDVSATSSVVVTVGAATATSSFGAYVISSPGGIGGTSASIADGGTGGSATGGDININGDSGTMGVVLTGPFYLGGKGGSGLWGGFSYGNGGHGGANGAGSAGNQGIVIVYW